MKYANLAVREKVLMEFWVFKLFYIDSSVVKSSIRPLSVEAKIATCDIQ